MLIESTQNSRIKNLLKLQEKSRERKKQGLFVVEGIQENRLALESGFVPDEFYILDSIFEDSLELPLSPIYVSREVFQKIAYRESTGGIVGVYKTRETALTEIQIKENALIVVLESVEKPGNLGAILRTCDAANIDLLIVCDPLVDFYNPNVIRSSVGALFTNQFVSDSTENVVKWLKENQIQITATFLQETTQNLYDVNLNVSTAIVLGTENSGLTDFWADEADVLVKIPMLGKIDSLNVSNAAAICVFEAIRQKNYSKT